MCGPRFRRRNDGRRPLLELPRLKAKVELVESLGSEIIAHFDIGQTRLADVDPDESRTFRTMSRRSGALIQEVACIGDEIEVVLDVQRLHFFDVETQISI